NSDFSPARAGFFIALKKPGEITMKRIPKTSLGLGLQPVRGPRSKLLDKTLNILWAGQSNAGKMFTAFSGAGNAAFEEALEGYYPSVNSSNGATNGCAIHKDANNGSGYYWDLDNNEPGPELIDALEAIDTAGINRKDIDIIVICHG